MLFEAYENKDLDRTLRILNEAGGAVLAQTLDSTMHRYLLHCVLDQDKELLSSKKGYKLISLLIQLCPEALLKRDASGRLPLHYAFSISFCSSSPLPPNNNNKKVFCLVTLILRHAPECVGVP